MKLENVEYCYRRDIDRWLIIFPTHAEAKAFEGYYSDGKYKPHFCTYTKTTTETTRYRAIYAKLTGRFEQVRQLCKAKCMHDTIIDDLEFDGTFDKIELIFDTESGIASFRIEKFETWTDWTCKNILNSQYGADADPSKKVKVTRYEFGNYSGFIDYVELSPRNVCDITTVHFSSRTMFWIDDKPYRFYDALKIFGNIRLYDILDVVPEYYEEPDTDELGRPFCKTIHITLKPSCVTVAAKVLEEIKPVHSDAYQGGFCVRRSCCGIGFGEHNDKYGRTEERIIFTVKNFCRGEADIIKVSPWTNTFIGTNKENEKEYSWVDFKEYMQKLSATGSDIWDLEWKYDETCPMTGTEVADKLHVYLKPLAYKRVFEEEDKKVWISSNASLWSNNDYLARLKALTPPPVPYWMRQDEDCKIGFRQKDKDELQKEIDEMTKRIYEKLEIKQVKDFDVDTAWYDYLTATEMAQVCEYCEQDLKLMSEVLAKDIKEENIMGPKDTAFAEYWRRLYWGVVTPVKPVKPTKILIQGTATIIWWSDGDKTVVKCQKGDKMDPEKGIAMCVMKKFMGTNETHSNYLDFAKKAIAEYEKQKAAEKAKKKAEADKKRRTAAKKKGADENANYKRTAETLSDAITALDREMNTGKEEP